jgi:copper chaperone CopZ
MISSAKNALAAGSLVLGAGIVCPLCLPNAEGSAGERQTASAQVTDTATVRLHISGMTCETCPTTARIALQKLTGVYSAKVTLDDSLGVVRYDPRRVTPGQIVKHLAQLTDYAAKVLPEEKAAKKPRAGSR